MEILKFWIFHNKSKTYSIKLNSLFQEAVKLISQYPNLGKPTSDENVRFKVVGDYLLFYELVDDQIHILNIWDSRQDPAKLILR